MTTDRAPTIRECVDETHADLALAIGAGLEAFGQAVAAQVERDVADFVVSRDFYDLMQVYRHTPRHELQATIDAFEAVKAAIRSAAGREE